MSGENEKNADQGKKLESTEQAVCSMCGIKLGFDESSWQVDDDGRILCRDCMAELNSCGCSD